MMLIALFIGTPLTGDVESVLALAESDAATIIVAEASGRIRDVVEIPISMANNPGITAIIFQINFDDSVMRYIGYEDKGLLKGPMTPPYSGGPEIKFSWQDFHAPANTASGEVAILKFEIDRKSVV
jgi:hypothetical protein